MPGWVRGLGCSRPFVRSAPVLAKALPKRQTCRAGLLERFGMESGLINGHRKSADERFLIEVQSGDVIEIDAMSLDLFRVIAE